MISKRVRIGMRAAMMLAVVMTMMFATTTEALAQTKYKITTDGNCEVYYYDNFERIVVTEAEAGKELSIWLKEDANPGNGKYFTGEFTMNGTSLGSNQWRYNEGFTMPAENVTIAAVKADKQTLSVDLTTTTRQEVPSAAALLFNGDDRLNYKDELEGYDVDNSGVADMVYTTSEDGMHMYVQRLAGADATGTYTLTYPDNTAMYGSISFVFPEPKKAIQSTWITVNGGPFTYTGQQIKPAVTIKDGTKDITQQFNISYNNNLNAGEATVTVTANAEGYTGSATKTFTIAPKPVTISGVKANDKVYDGTTDATIDISGATIDGKVGNDEVNIVAGSAVFSDKNAGDGKDITISGITLSGTSASNYTLVAQPASVTATIYRKALELVADAVTIQEGDAISPTFTGSVAGFVAGETIGSGETLLFSLSDPSATAAGSYGITGTLNGSASGNYGLNYTFSNAASNANAFVITAKPASTKTEVITNPDGSTTTTVTQTLETDGSSFTIDAEGGVSIGDGSDVFSGLSKGIQELLNRNVIANAASGSNILNPILVRTGDASNLLIKSVTETDAQGQTTATSSSMTIKQSGSTDASTGKPKPTKLAFSLGGANSDKCGINLTWKLSKSDGSNVKDVLTISGSGEMDNVATGYAWSGYCNQIKTVIIEEGVSSIGSFAFSGFESLSSDITIPASVTSIWNGAFGIVSKKTTAGISITAAAGSRLSTIREGAFTLANASIDLSNCTKLKAISDNSVFREVPGDVTLPSSVTSICQYAFGNLHSYPYSGEHVYVVVPKGKALKVTIEGVTDPVEITPTDGKADILGCLFEDPSNRKTSRELTLALTDTSTGGEGGGDNGGGEDPENPDAPTSGKFGNFTWELSKSDASSTVYDVLTISGSGEMNSMLGGSPWKDYKDQIKTVYINKPVTKINGSVTKTDEGVTVIDEDMMKTDEGVTSIGENVFAGFSGDHVYVTVPEGKIMSMNFDWNKSPEIIKPTDGKVDIIDYLFANPSNRTSSLAFPLVVGDIYPHLKVGDTFTLASEDIEITNTVSIHYKCYHNKDKNGTILLNEVEKETLLSNNSNRDFEIGLMVDATLTAELVAGSSDTYEVKENKATKLTFKTIPASIANGDTFFNRPENISFEGADIDIENIYSIGVDLAKGDKIKLVVPFGDKVGSINGSKSEDGQYNYHAFLEGSSEDSVLMLEIDSKNSKNDQGQEPSTRDKNDRAATTMIVNYETKKETDGGAATGDVSGGEFKVTAYNTNIESFKIVHCSRAATAEEEQEDDEIEIVSGQEYRILHDGYIVLNFYTPDAAITVKSIVFRRPGDANNDGYVDAADLVEMINAKTGKTSERFNLTNADIDRDGDITQEDIDAVVKIIMGE